MPFWLGEAPGRTRELSAAISQLREELSQTTNGSLQDDLSSSCATGSASVFPECTTHASREEHSISRSEMSTFRTDAGKASGTPSDNLATDPGRPTDAAAQHRDWLVEQCGATPWAAEQAVAYVAAQVAALGIMPTKNDIVFERFFDESGGMQLVIHAPWARGSIAPGASRCASGFAAVSTSSCKPAPTTTASFFRLGLSTAFAIDALFAMLGTHNAATLLDQALLAAPMFQVRWRWNVTRSLGGAAAAGRQARAAPSAAISLRRSVGRGLSGNGRLPGKSFWRRRRFPIIRWCGRRCTIASTRRWTSTAW